MSTIQCNIVSPEGELFSGPVELLSAEGGAGEIAITPRHAPLLTNLKPGPVKLVLEGGEEEIFFAYTIFSTQMWDWYTLFHVKGTRVTSNCPSLLLVVLPFTVQTTP